MKLIQSQNFNSNYASKFIKVNNIRKHNNADRLQIITIDGNNCIVDLSVKEEDILLYCAVESQLNADFLRLNDLYEDKLMNTNTEQKGYINKHGRIRAINLRGENSSGLLLSPQCLSKLFKDLPNSFESYLDKEFDTIDDIQFSQKYIPKVNQINRSLTHSDKRNKKLKRFDKLIVNQFKFHIDTAAFAKNLDRFNIGDLIQISEKWHGTSWICSNILVNRKLSWKEKLARKFKVKIQEQEYGNIYASRSVVKNQYINPNKKDYYDIDIWKDINEKVMPLLQKGMTIYGEAVGYLPGSQTMIQKGFDYGCNAGEYKLYVYRITYTNPDGKVYEFSTQQVREYCYSVGLMPTNQLYYGTIADYLLGEGIQVEDDWRKAFYVDLATKGVWMMEKYDKTCKNKVPFEGIVIRKEISEIESYKLKCQLFLQKETKDLDNNEVDLESQN